MKKNIIKTIDKYLNGFGQVDLDEGGIVKWLMNNYKRIKKEELIDKIISKLKTYKGRFTNVTAGGIYKLLDDIGYELSLEDKKKLYGEVHKTVKRTGDYYIEIQDWSGYDEPTERYTNKPYEYEKGKFGPMEED